MIDLKEFAPEDLELEQQVTEVHVLPNHPLAVCTVKRIDSKADRYASSLWTFHLEGGEARRFTFGQAEDKHARWSPDGKEIAFLSDRSSKGTFQIHRLPTDGGEARRISDLARGASNLYWRPQGDRLLALGLVTVDPDDRAAGCDRNDGARAEAPDRDKPQLCWRLPYKLDGSGYLLDSRSHLFLVDPDSGGARQITQGDYDVRSATWAPDGNRICFSRTRDKKGEEHCTDIWMMSLGADGQPGETRRLSFEQSNSSSPSWSPDGRWIAFSGSLDDGDAQMRLWLIDVEAEAVSPLGADSLEVMGELQWNRDSSELAVIQVERGLQQIAAIRVPGGEARCVVGGEQHVSYLAASSERLVYTSETAASPLELYATPWGDQEKRQLSRFNDWWSQRRVPEVAYRRFQVPDGNGGHESIDGWLLRPAGRPSGPGPLLVDVHGGPTSYAPLRFSAHPYWQTLCSRGWSVLALNPVGSSSYGREFSDRLRGRWGELDLPQHLAAVEQLCREGLVDHRVAITGSSYGGYMSAYAVGHSKRFRTAVVCAPVANLESHFGASDSGYYADAYSSDGEPAQQRELLARLSPMSAIEKVRTPTLFLQGTDDERCPRSQSEELFVKLHRAGGAPTEMVLYPGGSHHVFGQGKPSHRIDIQRRIVEWLEHWVDQPLSGE